MTELLLISGMVLATFSIRLLPFALADRIHLPVFLQKALNYVPVAVLSAIIAPAVIMPQGELWVMWNNPYLLAGIAALLTAVLIRNLTVTIVAGMLTAFAVRILAG
jgi:branched-subunit amino acid transport protein